MEMFMGRNHTGIQIYSVKYSVWIYCCRCGNNTQSIIAVKYDSLKMYYGKAAVTVETYFEHFTVGQLCATQVERQMQFTTGDRHVRI